METKPAWQSKTLWVNLILALAAFIPGIGGWIAAHPDMLGIAFAVINVGLRLITKKEITIS